MTKKEQQRIAQKEMNRMIDDAIDIFNDSNSFNPDTCESKKLRSCNAKVYITDNYYVLQSYDTMIAFIDRRTDCLYDVLRLVYGYTATSAQHIRKFEHDYGTDKWGCHAVMTWRPC